MHEIDFLPPRYRERRAQRHNLWWRSALAAAVAVGLSIAATMQYLGRLDVEEEVAEYQPVYEEAVALTEKLDRLRKETSAAHSRARLIAYLSHPWPRSQVLSSITSPLPDAVMLTEVKIVRESSSASKTAMLETGRRRAGGPNAAEKGPVGLATDRDLKSLQEDFDTGEVVLQLSGEASEGEALHLYIARLAEDPLVAKAELTSIERKQKLAQTPLETEWSTFQVRVRLRPGYGQPDAPKAIERSPKPTATASTDTSVP